MRAVILLVTCKLGHWRLAVDAESLSRIDREHRILHFRDGTQTLLDTIEPVWDCSAGAVLALPQPLPCIQGWVVCGGEIFLLVDPGFFALERTSDPPPAPAPSQFLSHLFGRLLVFRTLATQGLLSAAISIKQALEVVPASALTPLDDKRTHIRNVLFWRGHAVPVADWPLLLVNKQWRTGDSNHFLLARSLQQRLLALPVAAPIQNEPADSAASPDPARPDRGVFGWYSMQCGPVALLDLDSILNC